MKLSTNYICLLIKEEEEEMFEQIFDRFHIYSNRDLKNKKQTKFGLRLVQVHARRGG